MSEGGFHWLEAVVERLVELDQILAGYSTMTYTSRSQGFLGAIGGFWEVIVGML